MLSVVVFAAATLATLGCALPQAPPTGDVVDPSLIPKALPVLPGAAKNFRLIEYHTETEHTKDYWTSCWNKDLSPSGPTLAPGWTGGMQKCLDGYNVDSWDGTTCGGSGWFKGPNGPYKNPLHCYHACAPCMEWFISQKSSSGICWSVHGGITPNYNMDGPEKHAVDLSASCHMGYQQV
ncbi:hypothetical protein XPA_007377 [Xanthoria parietina]